MLEIAAQMSEFSSSVCKGPLMRGPYLKFYNMTHLSPLTVLLSPKDLATISNSLFLYYYLNAVPCDGPKISP